MAVRRLVARRLVVVCVVPAVVAGAVVGWSTTRGEPTAKCSLEVPARVVVNQPHLTPPVRRGADCAAAGVEQAQWDAYSADGTLTSRLFFNWDFPDTWNLFAQGKRGVWTWRPAGATDDLDTGHRVPQNAPVRDLRLGSAAFLTVRRDGRRITLRAQFQRFDPASFTFVRWTRAHGDLQLRKPGGTTWTTVTTVTADDRGEATEVFDLAARYDYRLVIPDTTDTWGSSSRVVRKL